MQNMLFEGEPRRARLILYMVIAGLVTGLPVGWGIGQMIKAADVQHLPWSDDGALVIAAALLASGLGMVLLSVTQRGRAILANPTAPEFARQVKPAQTTFFLLQAGVLILAGAMLAAPVVFEVMRKAAPSALGEPLMAATLVGFALQSTLNLLIWRRADEVFRQVIAESGAASFWLFQGVFFLWACGAKFHVLPEISSWDAVTVLMGLYLLLSTIVAYRRGLN